MGPRFGSIDFCLRTSFWVHRFLSQNIDTELGAHNDGTTLGPGAQRSPRADSPHPWHQGPLW